MSATEASLPASTVHRLVQSLMSLGYVTQHQASKRSGTVSAVISVSGPAVRLTDDRISELATLVREVADDFALRMREP